MNIDQKWLVIFGLSVILFLANLDITAVNLALPVIAKDFHANLSEIQWVLSAYVIVGAMFIVTAGRCSDLFGQKKVCLIGVLIFIAGSLFSGLAASASFLILARVLQGLGTAFSYPSVFIMVLSIFPKEQRGVGLAALNVTTAIAWVSGPLIGGVLAYSLSWRWIFFFNVPVGILAFLCVLALYPNDKFVKKMVKFDYRGVITLSVGLMALMLGVNEMNAWGSGSTRFVVCILVTSLFFLLFYIVEHRQLNPLLKIDMLKNTQVLFAMFIRMIFLFGLNALLFTIAFYLQNVLGFTSLHAGKLLLAMMIVFGVISPFSGKMIDRYGAKVPTVVGMLLFAFAFIFLANLKVSVSYWLLVPALMFSGFTASIIFSSTNILAATAVNEYEVGLVTSLVITGGFISASLGIALAGTLLEFNASYYLHSRASSLIGGLSSKQQDYLEAVASGARPFSDVVNHFSTNMVEKLIPTLKSAYLSGFLTCMSLCAILAVIGFILAIRVKK